MEADAASSLKPPAPEEASQEDPSPARFSSTGAAAPATTVTSPGAREVAAAMEAVERDAAAIAESYASLFASLRITLSNVLVLTTAAKFPSFFYYSNYYSSPSA